MNVEAGGGGGGRGTGGRPLDALIHLVLAEREGQGLLRRRREVRRLGGMRVEVGGRTLVNFASNDYLGLAQHPRILAAAERALREQGLGSGASPLVTGHTPLHAAAEAALARWKSCEGAVLLPSGYQAAHAAVGAIAAVGARNGDGVRFLLDRLSHASLIDAVRASGREHRVFPHNDLGKLERLLSSAPAGQLQVVVTESIFSMDGDAADLEGLARLKAKHGFALLLDEAHGSGVYGAGGAGYAAERGLAGLADVTIVTLSKALGAAGGAVCGSRAVCEAVVNLGRACVYSTAVPAVVAAAATEALAVMRDEPWRQRRVRELAGRMREALGAAGRRLPAGDSPIIPIILGGESAALEASARLEERGFLVPAIRPPTVPRGTSRLRITVSSEHQEGEVGGVVGSL